MVALIALAASIVALSIAAGALLRARRRGDLPAGAPVIVATRRPDDQSIHGIVVRDDRHGITLAAANYLDPDGTVRPIGDVWIERPVAFVQTGVAPLPVRSSDAVGEPGRAPAPALPDNRHLTSVAE